MSPIVRTTLALLFEVAVMFGLYWLFVGSLNAPEIVLGAAVALAATVASHAVGARLGARFFASARWLAQAFRLPWLIATGTADILKVLALHLFTHKELSRCSAPFVTTHAATTRRRTPSARSQPPTRPSRRTSSSSISIARRVSSSFTRSIPPELHR